MLLRFWLISIHSYYLQKQGGFALCLHLKSDSSCTFQMEENALYTPARQTLLYHWLLNWMVGAFIKRKWYLSTLHGIHVHSSSVAAMKSAQPLSRKFHTCSRCSSVCCSIDFHMTSHCFLWNRLYTRKQHGNVGLSVVPRGWMEDGKKKKRYISHYWFLLLLSDIRGQKHDRFSVFIVGPPKHLITTLTNTGD